MATSFSVAHSAIRAPLWLIPKGLEVPVFAGPCRGMKWAIGAGTHGCWLGTYERENQHKIASNLRAGDIAYDIGANVGFFTLLMAHIVGPGGHVHAFEPLPANLAQLRRHIAINGLHNVTVHPVAISDATGQATFKTANHDSEGRLSNDGDITVQTVALDDLRLPLPHLIKMDIEGEECLALSGMARTLRQARPYLLIEGHRFS